MVTQPPNKPFVSLIAKAILAVSFATIVASTSVMIVGKIALDNNFAQERRRAHQFYRQAFNSILQRSKLHEVNIGWLIPSFIDHQTDSENVLAQIARQIETNWFKIELVSDIKSAYLLSSKGELIGKWGETLEDISPLANLYQYVIQNEQPKEQIVCGDDCTHIYVSPFLHDGKFIGIFIFGVDLAETVIQMQGITGADIGILIEKSHLSPDHNLQLLDVWSMAIIALTNATKNLPLLSKLMQQSPDLSLAKNSRFKYQQRFYEISAIPFADGQNNASLIIIDDITEELAVIHKATVYYALNGLFSLLLSGSIILFLLIRPTRKLRALISLLPLIAEKKYSQVIDCLPKHNKRTLFRDEITVLDDATQNLMLTLRQLDNEVELRTARLSEQAIELQNEKRFVSNILDTAQVIIMTLDSTGKILSLNKYAEHLTGYRESAIINTLFTDYIFDLNNFVSVSTILHELTTQERDTYRSECSIFSTDGTELFISWFFTLLNNPDESPEILVVGLNLTERKEIESQLAWLADHDPLTNLFNRRRFELEFKRILAFATRYQQTGALIYFDVDQFKFINDSSGHNVGDELLVRIAEHLLMTTRETDVVARFGGDEFVVLAPQVNDENAEQLAKTICREMATIEISTDKSIHRVSISAGVLMFPVEGYSEQDLLASVDLAMYKAKELGRGGWYFASANDIDRDEIRKRVNWKAKIEQALQQDRFVLYFQPIMQVADKSISHYECLLRMLDEEGKVIPPGMFISIAEQTGLMHEIDARVLQLAFSHQVNFIKHGLDITLSVNLSGEMISRADAFKMIMELQNKTRAPLNKFIFEMTESQAVTNLQSAQNFMSQINLAGGSFALDDFGVGFSSLSYLKQLPVQYLKIDGSFVEHLVDSREDKLFVNAINSVGQGMGIKTIAEFVHSEQILEILYLIGVDYAQGHGIGRPRPRPEFHDLNRSNA